MRQVRGDIIACAICLLAPAASRTDAHRAEATALANFFCKKISFRESYFFQISAGSITLLNLW
jgi:hypothetical protein